MVTIVLTDEEADHLTKILGDLLFEAEGHDTDDEEFAEYKELLREIIERLEPGSA